MKATQTLTVIAVALCIGCNTNPPNTTASAQLPSNTKDSTSPADSFVLKETFREADTVHNEYLTEELKPIRENFKRINGIAKWTSTAVENLEETSEGGEAKYYYQGNVLEKITARNYGETFQQLTEYYLLNGQLSFVFEKTYKYNRPIYYDSTTMKDNKDEEAFDFGKSEIMEDRSYFKQGQLLHQVNNKDSESPFSKEHLLEEQKRLLADFNKLKAVHTSE